MATKTLAVVIKKHFAEKKINNKALASRISCSFYSTFRAGEFSAVRAFPFQITYKAPKQWIWRTHEIAIPILHDAGRLIHHNAYGRRSLWCYHDEVAAEPISLSHSAAEIIKFTINLWKCFAAFCWRRGENGNFIGMRNRPFFMTPPMHSGAACKFSCRKLCSHLASQRTKNLLTLVKVLMQFT